MRGADTVFTTFIPIVAEPEQLLPLVQVATYEVFMVGLTFKVFPVPKEPVEPDTVQFKVPVQLAAVMVTESPEQIPFLFEVRVGFCPKPPTVIVLLAEVVQAAVIQDKV
jgi:hypothetical protein